MSIRNAAGVRLEHRALHGLAGGIADLRALALDHDPIAVLQVADRVGERRQRDGVRAEIHLALAVADRQRRAAPRADQHVLLALEQERERERALEPRQRRGDRLDRTEPFLHFAGDEVGDDLGVGLALKLEALLLELFAQLAEILDDAVVHDGHPVAGMRMGIGLVRLAVGCPAGMADAGGAGERVLLEPALQVLELALGAPPGQVPRFQRGNAGRVIAAIFQPLERVDQLTGDRLMAEDSNNAAHYRLAPPQLPQPRHDRPCAGHRA